jgi:hypothetical protein
MNARGLSSKISVLGKETQRLREKTCAFSKSELPVLEMGTTVQIGEVRL